MKPVLILQLRPEDDASDDEFQAFLEKGGLSERDVVRHRLEQADLPGGFSLEDYSAVVVGGGPGCVSDDPATRDPAEARAEAEILRILPEIVARDFPFMGCCAGIGILAHAMGGEVSKARFGEPVSPVLARLTEEGARDPLLASFPDSFEVFVGHKEALQELPEGAVHLMASETCPYQMIRVGRNVYATQFHPEADGPVFAERIRIYRDHGYFRPEDAETLTERVLAADVRFPEQMLARFFEKYVSSKRASSA